MKYPFFLSNMTFSGRIHLFHQIELKNLTDSQLDTYDRLNEKLKALGFQSRSIVHSWIHIVRYMALVAVFLFGAAAFSVMGLSLMCQAPSHPIQFNPYGTFAFTSLSSFAAVFVHFSMDRMGKWVLDPSAAPNSEGRDWLTFWLYEAIIHTRSMFTKKPVGNPIVSFVTGSEFENFLADALSEEA